MRSRYPVDYIRLRCVTIINLALILKEIGSEWWGRGV